MSPFSLPADLGSPGAARRWLADECAGQDVSDEACYSAQLATSELVTNAVIHARSAVTLVLLLTAGALRVEVSDDDPTRPQSRDASAAATSGRGMQTLDAVVPDAKKVRDVLEPPGGLRARPGDLQPPGQRRLEFLYGTDDEGWPTSSCRA